MPGWFRRLRKPSLPPLTGAPEVRRVKTYSASSGYVYQYVYEGRRALAGAVEYVFSVSAGRSRFFPVSLMLPDASVEQWQAAHGRELGDTERYGIAKMALWSAMDERPRPDDLLSPVLVAAGDVEILADQLGLE